MDCLACGGGIVATEKYGSQMLNVCLFGHRTAYYQESVDMDVDDLLNLSA